jgi:acyl carrier protein
MRQRVLAIIADHTAVKFADIHPDTRLADLHMDSLELMSAMYAIEGITDLNITQAQIAGLVTVGDLLGLVEV